MTAEEYNKTVDLYSDNVYRFILKMVKNEMIAEDIVQDAFEKLWVRYTEVAFGKSKPYLFSRMPGMGPNRFLMVSAMVMFFM